MKSALPARTTSGNLVVCAALPPSLAAKLNDLIERRQRELGPMRRVTRSELLREGLELLLASAPAVPATPVAPLPPSRPRVVRRRTKPAKAS